MSISEFKATCLKVIERIRKTGEPLIITKNGVNAAVIYPPSMIEKQEKPLFGKLKDKGKILGDVITPLSSEMWEVMK